MAHLIKHHLNDSNRDSMGKINKKAFNPKFKLFLFAGDGSRQGSFSGPSTTCQISLYRIDDQDPYGFGLRVVGQQLPVDPQLQQQQQQQQQQLQHLCARVLWISPGGPAHRAGIKVGDRVSPVSQFHPDFDFNLSFSNFVCSFPVILNFFFLSFCLFINLLFMDAHGGSFC